MIALKDIHPLQTQNGSEPEMIQLSEETIQERLHKVLENMKKDQLDVLLVYGDKEHGSNLEYLTGFVPRFEEAVLVLHTDGKAWLLLGNENLNKAGMSRIPVSPVHVPFFSLPNQPMQDEEPLAAYFKKAGLQAGMKIGIAGWKLFTSSQPENERFFDIPAYLLEGIREAAPDARLVNATRLFIGEGGARRTNSANEIAHYELGSVLASQGVQRALEAVKEGVSEMELGSLLNSCGQDPSVVTIASTGRRFEYANLYPSNKKVKKGDPMSLTCGYRGGLSSRAGYAVNNAEELPAEIQDWEEQLAKPYFKAAVTWLETLRPGLEGGQLYERMEEVLPKAEYSWSLCPGHLVAEEEWLASPIYKGSKEKLESGMLLQLDIIPGKPGYGGVSMESGFLLADEALQKKMEEQYPALFQRLKARQDFVRKEIGIALPDEVFPFNDTAGVYAPYFMNPNRVFSVF